MACGLSSRNLRNRKYEHCEGAGAIRVVPTKSADPKRDPNDPLHFYNAIVSLWSGDGFILGNGVQTDEFHRYIVNNRDLNLGLALNLCALATIPRPFYDTIKGAWRSIDIMAHEPDFSNGIPQFTSRIAAAIKQRVRGQKLEGHEPTAAMIRFYCKDTKNPHCYCDSETKHQDSTELQDIHKLQPKHGILSTTYNGEFIEGRLMPSFKNTEVVLDNTSPQAVAEALRAAMLPEQFVASVCWAPGQKPVIINHEE